MATTWNDLVSYVRVRYEIFRQTDRTLDFELPTTNGRTQRVAVHHVSDDRVGGEWIQIESPIARADGVDLAKLLELAGESVVGGVAVAGGVAMFRHAAALSELTLAGFDRPFQLVVSRADELEHELTGADHF
ncbi:MAG: hypothetical protein M3Z25_17735 [Actinomycetota bacterium]|nr:hypothetical protein [Pseudonocardiales bacterium]MDQ2709349.1 hypothetical protein [Actinomycetota bacterium]